ASYGLTAAPTTGNRKPQTGAVDPRIQSLVMPTRERSEAGKPALSEAEGNLLFADGDNLPTPSSRLSQSAALRR
ncbi:MAG: hypothetical protein ABSB14_23240, partial [Candidatus Sulfotelmatobacter sp.]